MNIPNNGPGVCVLLREPMYTSWQMSDDVWLATAVDVKVMRGVTHPVIRCTRLQKLPVYLWLWDYCDAGKENPKSTSQ